MKIRCFITGLITATAVISTAAADYKPSYTLIDNVNYECEDLGVASFNVLDFGVDNTGENDCTQTVQYLLNVAGGNSYNTTGNHDNLNSSGGVVYFPAGTYRFNGGRMKNFRKYPEMHGVWRASGRVWQTRW